VRRIVLGCLSRDEGTRVELRCAMARENQEGEGRKRPDGGGRRERRKGRGGEEGAWYQRNRSRVLEGRRMHAEHDLQVERHLTLSSHFQLVIFLADGTPRLNFPLM
jgi:hypothetical protein